MADHAAISISSDPDRLNRRPGIGSLGSQLCAQAIFGLVVMNFIRPDILRAIPTPILFALGLAAIAGALAWAIRRQIRSSKVLQPELPVLQRTAMGDARDQQMRDEERAADELRSWIGSPIWLRGFLVANLVLMAPWGAPGIRIGMLALVHLIAACWTVARWLRARRDGSR